MKSLNALVPILMLPLSLTGTPLYANQDDDILLEKETTFIYGPEKSYFFPEITFTTNNLSLIVRMAAANSWKTNRTVLLSDQHSGAKCTTQENPEPGILACYTKTKAVAWWGKHDKIVPHKDFVDTVIKGEGDAKLLYKEE